MAAQTGALAKSDHIEIISREAEAPIPSKGDLVGFDSSGRARKASITESISNIVNGFGIALEDGVDGTAMKVAVGNTWVYTTLGNGPFVPQKAVVRSSTAGRVTAGTYVATNAVVLNSLVGRYVAHELEESDGTAASTGEVGIVRLGL